MPSLSVLDLEKVSVDDIMVPRNEIVGIDINDDWKAIVRQLTHSQKRGGGGDYVPEGTHSARSW